MVKLHAGLVYEYVCRFVVNVYASSANVWLTGVLIVHVPVLVPVHDAFLRNATVVKLHAGLVYEYVYRFAVNVYASSANVWLTGVLIVHVHVPVLVPVHDAFLTNATVAATVWLAGVLIVHVHVHVHVHDAFLFSWSSCMPVSCTSTCTASL
jgi:hypothetical protein